MAYLHCHKCGWQQDDFYDEGYNPAKSLLDWNEYLFGENKHRLDETFTNDSQFIKENGNITSREVIAREYEKFAKRIREMKWMSLDDFRKDYKSDKAECPNCGCSNGFDVD